MSVEFEHCHKGALGNLDISYLPHAAFAPLLFFQQFSFTGNVSSVTFCSHVFPYSLDCLACNYFCAYRSLNCNIELLAGYKFLNL